jgi:hypothetical protein
MFPIFTLKSNSDKQFKHVFALLEYPRINNEVSVKEVSREYQEVSINKEDFYCFLCNYYYTISSRLLHTGIFVYGRKQLAQRKHHYSYQRSQSTFLENRIIGNENCHDIANNLANLIFSSINPRTNIYE